MTYQTAPHEDSESIGLCAACPFCDYQLGHETLFVRLLGERITDRTLISTKNFLLWPGLGPIAAGYALVLPRRHYLSIGAIPATLSSELWEFVDRSIVLLSRAFDSRVVVFEHGAASELSKAGSCIDHAHLHLLTSSIDILDTLEGYFNMSPIEDLSLLGNLHLAGIGYIFYRGLDGKMYAALAPKKMPSQFLRMLFAHQSSFSGDWNWRSNPNPEQVVAIYDRLKSISEDSRVG